MCRADSFQFIAEFIVTIPLIFHVPLRLAKQMVHAVFDTNCGTSVIQCTWYSVPDRGTAYLLKSRCFPNIPARHSGKTDFCAFSRTAFHHMPRSRDARLARKYSKPPICRMPAAGIRKNRTFEKNGSRRRVVAGHAIGARRRERAFLKRLNLRRRQNPPTRFGL